MADFVHGDRAQYLPQEMNCAPLPVTVVSGRVRLGRLAVRQVRDEFGAVWTAREDELSHPDGPPDA